MEMLARSACVSVVPGSAYRPFLLVFEVTLAADESVWDCCRDFVFVKGGIEPSRSGLG